MSAILVALGAIGWILGGNWVLGVCAAIGFVIGLPEQGFICQKSNSIWL